MKIKKFFSTTVLVLSAVLSAPAFAHFAPPEDGVLSSHPQYNKNLTEGEYEFGDVHGKFGKFFSDRFKFTVAEDSTASITVNDLELSLGDLGQGNFKPLKKSGSLPNLIDIKNLSFRLFDNTGNLLGSGGDGDTLTNLNLFAGNWYTLKVTGRVSGLFGGAYSGTLDINPTAVPLGDTAPLLGSALALLGLRYRKRLTRSTH